jgi:hypothetical protein
MFCNIRRYRVAQGQMDEVLHRIDTEFCDRIEREPGFVGYQACDCGDGTLITLTTFRDSEAAANSATIAGAYVRDSLGDIDIERVAASNGEVKVSRAIAEMLHSAHA